MTPRERINAAMNLMPVDKIPLMCQLSIGHMLMQLKISPVEFWFDPFTFANGLIKLREMYDFDGILISLHGHDPNWRDVIDRIYSTEEYEIVEWKNGDKTFCPYNDLPFYKSKYQKEEIDLTKLVEDNLPTELNYIPVSQNLHFHINGDHKFDIINYIIKKTGNNYSIHGELTSPFDYLLDYIGLNNSMLALIDDPEKCLMILSHFTKLIKQLAIEMCETGLDAIKISSPFAGAGFISPDDYRTFVLPFEKEIALAIREKDVHAYIHTCGEINDRLELMFEAGISGIECLDPPPLGNVELSEAVTRIGNKGFIKGNIDSVNLLLNSEEKEIIDDVRARIEIGSKKKGFIISTACSIAPPVKKGNILLLRKIVDKYGVVK
ncbi:MAG: uroporphyrinogen decarboxylase family protein [Melioribacteraceae bacterium]|nr:uroporphyrinogen decarboxylase family protein [Melioribacteraceae bacterium]